MSEITTEKLIEIMITAAMKYHEWGSEDMVKECEQYIGELTLKKLQIKRVQEDL